MESLKAALRGSGYSEQATLDIANAMSTLAHYGLLGQGFGLGNAPPPPGGTTPTSPAGGGMQNPLAAATGYGPPANVQASRVISNYSQTSLLRPSLLQKPHSEV